MMMQYQFVLFLCKGQMVTQPVTIFPLVFTSQ